MDKKQLMKWLGGIAGRGIAWFFAVKLGVEASQASSWGAAAGQAIGSLILVGLSVYSSVKGRKKLLAAAPSG